MLVLAALALSPISPLPVPNAGDRILVVSPHPDDETIGAGGYLEEAVRAGANVEIVIATDGAKRGRASVRFRETTLATGRLGVPPQNLVFLKFPDGRLSAQRDFPTRLAEILNKFHPNIVIGTDPKDYHPDHAAVGRAIDGLGKTSGQPFTAYFFVVHYHRYPQPDAFRPDLVEVPASKIPEHWEALTLTPEAEEAKKDAVLEYHSQLLPKNPLRRGLLISFIRRSEIFGVRAYGLSTPPGFRAFGP